MINLNVKAVMYRDTVPVFYLTLTITGQVCGSGVTLGKILSSGVA